MVHAQGGVVNYPFEFAKRAYCSQLMVCLCVCVCVCVFICVLSDVIHKYIEGGNGRWSGL